MTRATLPEQRNKRKFGDGEKGRWEDLKTKKEKASSLCHLLKPMQTAPVSTIPMQTKQTNSLCSAHSSSLCVAVSVVLSVCTDHACTVPGRPKTLPSPVGPLRDSNMAGVHLPAAGQLESCLDFIRWLSELG
ncbi:hypothetical protein QQF64_034973 [Cirrhinus molitorella]|uniref:Uncharacterized protein n=1 Tax=Cirrhinus molitorella TaxID=172907 RepID=A0ABR3NF97_9TELE